MKKNNRFILSFDSIIEISLILLIFLTVVLSFSWSKYKNKNLFSDIRISSTKINDIVLYEDYIHNILQSESITFPSFINSIEEHPYIKAARVSKHYPGKIYIEIIERNPIVFLNTNPKIFLDEEGYVLPYQEKISKIDLPIMSNINPNQNLYPNGQKVLSKKVIECISWLALINKNYKNLYNDISEIKMTSTDEMEIILAENPTNIYFGQTQLRTRINNLVQFQKLLEPKRLSDFSYLDMRFENQIIAKERRL
jgi:cell division septal protein FtsQ